MNINQRLFDRQIEHSILTRRYSEGARLMLERIANNHRGRLSKILSTSLQNSIEEEMRRYAMELLSSSTTSVRDLIGAEIDFNYNSLNKEIGEFYRLERPSRFELSSRLLSEPINFQDRTLSQSVDSIVSVETAEVNRFIRQGIADKRTEKQIIEDVMKRTKLSESQAKTLVTTHITHAETMVKEELARANPIIKSFIFTAILDSRTSRLCSSLDGTVQPVDKILYRPPLHWNCRSILAPVLKSKEELSREIANDRINMSKLVDLDDDLLDGIIPEKETFEAWIRRQARETQLKYFDSEEKLELFQRGSIKFSDFFIKGRPVGLSALRVLDNLLTFTSTITLS